MKAYKGFNKDKYGAIYCQPTINNRFVYEEGKTYECEDAILCKKGFHACTLPIDVFNYYSSKYVSVEYHEVELEGVSEEREYDSKVVGTKITIGRKVTPDEMVDISIKTILDDKEKYFPDNEPYKIRKDTKWNYLHKDGTFLLEQWFDWVDNFVNGFARVELNDKYNFLKPDGTYLSEQWFDFALDFYNGFAQVKLNDKTYKLNDKGELFN